MGRIYKRGKIWYMDVSVKGARIRKKVGKSKKVAELALKDTEVKIAKDEFGLSHNDVAIDRLLKEFLDYSKTNNRASTTKRYKAVCDHFQRFLSLEKPNIKFASQITPAVVESYKSFRRNQWINPNGLPVKSVDDIKESSRKGARARTVNLELDALRAILNLAIEWEYLKHNPLTKVKRLKEDDRKPLRFLTIEECRKFLDACPSELYPAYFTFLHTGMRKAELEHIQWENVDFKRRIIEIRGKGNWQPKTGQREIPMSSDLFEILLELKKLSKDVSKTAYVFNIRESGHSHNRLRRELIKIANIAEIENLTMIHTLRHTFASNLVMKGVDLPTVMKLMGHSDIQTTMIYAHLAPDHLADAVNKLSFS